jgi:hypothetical protein
MEQAIGREPTLRAHGFHGAQMMIQIGQVRIWVEEVDVLVTGAHEGRGVVQLADIALQQGLEKRGGTGH